MLICIEPIKFVRKLKEFRIYGNLSTKFKLLEVEHSAYAARETGLSDRVKQLEQEKEEWRKVSEGQVERIRQLEEELGKKNALMSEEQADNATLRKEKEDLAITLGQNEMMKLNVVLELVPDVVRRLLDSNEYKTSLAVPLSLSFTAGWLGGVSLDRSKEDLGKILADTVRINKSNYLRLSNGRNGRHMKSKMRGGFSFTQGCQDHK